MSQEKEMLIEIMTDHPQEKDSIYAGLFVPATKGQIESAMQQARAIGRETFIDIRIHNCPGLPELTDTRMECPTVDEINFFAYRLTTLDEKETLALNAIFNQRKENGNYDEVGVSMKELINLTYGLSDIPVVGDMDSDEKLGEFVLENDMDETFRHLNKELIPILDKAKIGKEFRKSEKGIFFEGCYVSAGNYIEQNVYDGENLPEEMPVEYGEGIIHLLVGKPATPELQNDSKWIALPIQREIADEIAREMGARRIEDCVYFDMKSAIPFVDEQAFDDTEKFDKLNRIAATYTAMNDANRVKFKALMEGAGICNLDKALELIDNISEYEFSYYSNHTGNYAAEYLSKVLPTNADMDLFSIEVKQSIGKKLLNKMSATMTEYGVISQKGKGLFPTIQNEELNQDEEQDIGTMQM